MANYITQVGPKGIYSGGSGGWPGGYYEIPYGATVVPDLANGLTQEITLTGNVIFGVPVRGGGALIAGDWLVLKIIQDATGSRTITWNAVYLLPPDLTPAPDTLSIVSWKYNLDGAWEIDGAIQTGVPIP